MIYFVFAETSNIPDKEGWKEDVTEENEWRQHPIVLSPPYVDRCKRNIKNYPTKKKYI